MNNQYGLIGFPLGHSFSKQYFEQKFVNEHLHDCTFNLFAIENIRDFTTLLKEQKNLKGLAVTIPYKQSIMPLLNSISAEAKAIGAVNCIKIRNGLTKGYNTDVVGFEYSLRPLLKPHHTHALVLGTGGASKAVQYVLQKLQINFTLVNRAINEAANNITYEQITEAAMQQHLLIINATPMGMVPNEHTFAAIDYTQLTPQHLCYDLVYKPEVTTFLQKAAAQGAAIKNGFEMLILQAEQNWNIWNED